MSKIVESQEKTKARAELMEAVAAMDEFHNMPLYVWERKFPSFTKAVNNNLFVESGNDVLAIRIKVMFNELQLRQARYLMHL